MVICFLLTKTSEFILQIFRINIVKLIIYMSLLICLAAPFAKADSSEQAPAQESSTSSFIANKDLAGIPYKKEAESYASVFSGFGFALLILCAGFFLLSRNKDKLSRLGLLPLEQGKHLKILDRQKLHADNIAYLISVDERKYLLVVGRAGVSISETNT